MQRVIEYAVGLQGIKYKCESGPDLFIEQRLPAPRRSGEKSIFYYFSDTFFVYFMFPPFLATGCSTEALRLKNRSQTQDSFLKYCTKCVFFEPPDS